MRVCFAATSASSLLVRTDVIDDADATFTILCLGLLGGVLTGVVPADAEEPPPPVPLLRRPKFELRRRNGF